MTGIREHDGEPVPGLPAALPPGETLLWQGAPVAMSLARAAFRIRGVALYFAALAGWRATEVLAAGTGAGALPGAIVPTLAMGAVVLLLLAGLATLNARCTLYSITDRRIVMRFGVALPMTVNLPFSQLEGARLRVHPDGSGDLALGLLPSTRVSYLVFWPHARPWHFARVQPSLRAIAEPERVAALLQAAVSRFDAPAATSVVGVDRECPGPTGFLSSEAA